MSRVVIPAGKSFNSYHLLKLVSTYGEDVLENNIRQHVENIFPDFFVIPFKRDIESAALASIKKRPDLAIIDRKLKTWGIVEVEITEHSLSHVLEQVSVFVGGKYNHLETARYVKDKLWTHCGKKISLQRIEKLLKEEAPKVLVIADGIKEEWRDQLERAGAELCAFEIYKNTRGLHLFRTSGKYPILPTREAHVRRTPASANLFEVTSDFSFKKVTRNKVIIIYEEIVTEWALITTNGKLYLQFYGGANPLIGTDTYVVFADRKERYYFRRN